jgi:hypothetical protein
VVTNLFVRIYSSDGTEFIRQTGLVLWQAETYFLSWGSFGTGRIDPASEIPQSRVWAAGGRSCGRALHRWVFRRTVRTLNHCAQKSPC